MIYGLARDFDQDGLKTIPVLSVPNAANIEYFSDRLIRNASGELLRFDARPVNAFLSNRDTLRTGFNWSKRFRRTQSEQNPPAANRLRPAAERRRRGNRQPSDRVSVSLYHTLRLTDDIQFRENGPILDLLGGAALSRRGGQPSHEIEARVNVRRKNYGCTIFLTHESGKTLGTATATGSQPVGDLRFSPVTKGNLRLYYDLGRTSAGRRVPRKSWRSNLRVSLGVDNIGNHRPRVQTDSGVIPFAYEPAALDPEGRVVRLSLRKMFSMRRRR